jgi:hypothetical protein
LWMGLWSVDLQWLSLVERILNLPVPGYKLQVIQPLGHGQYASRSAAPCVTSYSARYARITLPSNPRLNKPNQHPFN